MSLDYDVSQVKDFQLYFPDEVDKITGKKSWNSKVQPLVFYCMFLGLEGINKRNIDEYLFRFRFYTKLFGHMFNVRTENKTEGFEITRELLDKAVGLIVNVVTEPRSKWVKRMVDNFSRDISREITAEKRDITFLTNKIL